jgi:branched-chain amino acid transport system substrate-binding protein
MPENQLTADLFSRSPAVTSHRIILLVGAMLFGIAGGAQAAGDIAIVRDLASRVGPVIGSAQACRDIARPRIQTIVDKFSQVIRESSSNEAERSDLSQTFDRTVAEGRAAVTSGRMDCIRADRQLADLERSISGPSLSSVIGLPPRRPPRMQRPRRRPRSRPARCRAASAKRKSASASPPRSPARPASWDGR